MASMRWPTTMAATRRRKMSCLLMLCCSPSRSPTVAMTALGLMNWLARRHSFWRGDVCLLEWSVVVGETISLMLRLKTGCCLGSLCGAGIGSCGRDAPQTLPCRPDEIHPVPAAGRRLPGAAFLRGAR